MEPTATDLVEWLATYWTLEEALCAIDNDEVRLAMEAKLKNTRAQVEARACDMAREECKDPAERRSVIEWLQASIDVIPGLAMMPHGLRALQREIELAVAAREAYEAAALWTERARVLAELSVAKSTMQGLYRWPGGVIDAWEELRSRHAKSCVQ